MSKPRAVSGSGSEPPRARAVQICWSHVAVAVAIIGASLVAGAQHPAGADAGADLALSAASGPVGTTLDLWSPDIFSMDADMCPDLDGTRSWDDGDTFEVRWELGLMADGAVGNRVIEGADFLYTTLGTEVVTVLDTGSVSTDPGVPWRTTVTVPEGVAPGQRLVVNASCWRLGSAVEGGEQEWMTYYYLPVFTVSDADGSIPTTSSTTAPPAAPAPSSGPSPASVPTQPPAAARPGTASFTG